MTRKFGAQRKRAFLGYLAQSGNQTLSAERAKVSRSWVCLHRATDPDFDARCRQAIAEAVQSLEPPQDRHRGETRSNRPAVGWRYFAGAELVIAGSNKRHAQVRRGRLKQWTARVEKRFLAALAATCNVKAACAEVGMWPASAYNHRRRWPTFAAAWDAAVENAYMRIEAALIEAGCNLHSELEFEPDIAIEGMTVWHAMQLLYMHRHQVRGIGGRPGLPSRPATDREVELALRRSLRKFGVKIDEEDVSPP